MKCFGTKELFAIEYEMFDAEYGYFELWVNNKSVCCFEIYGRKYMYEGKLSDIVDWLNTNMINVLEESKFPLPINADTSLDFFNKSGNFDSNDMNEFDRWYDKRQAWYFRHSWYCVRGGSYLPEVMFRKVSNKIEIEWDNTHTYEGVRFINPNGLYYVDITLFQMVTNNFIQDFYDTHKIMEQFWNQYRIGGKLYGEKPTIGEYNRASYSFLLVAGISKKDAASAVRSAYSQQRSYKLTSNEYVARIPGRINQKIRGC